MRLLTITLLLAGGIANAAAAEVQIQVYDVPARSGAHDVAPSPQPNGPVWYTAQRQGTLGKLDPVSGRVEQIPLGSDSAPHGVIIGPDGAPWITDGGLNAIVRVDPQTHAVRSFPLPEARGYVNLNTAVFDRAGRLWFTGQNGVYGRVDPASGDVQVWDAPRGRGAYGITATPDGQVYYASLAGSHIARIDPASGVATVVEPPTAGQGARRVWSDSRGNVWVSEWNSGQVSRFDPKSSSWQTWKLPGDRPRVYAVYVDENDIVWLSEWGANAMVRFDPETQKFESFPSERSGANVRQIHGRKGEVWAPESGADKIVVYRTK
jgi:virginiamycin B lyase